MNYGDFARELEAIHARVMRHQPTNWEEQSDIHLMWAETAEAFQVTMEEMRVAEEELLQQSKQIEDSQQAIELERQRYRDLLNFAPDGYLVTELNGLIREANPAAGDLLGVSPRFLNGKALATYVALDARPVFRSGLNRLLRVGRAENWIVRIQPRRGQAYDATMTAAVVRAGDGTPTGLRWFLRKAVHPGAVGDALPRSCFANGAAIDLPQDRAPGDQLSARLAAAEREVEALRGLLNGLDLIVWEADADTGQYWFISPRAEQVLGHPVENWLDDPGFWSQIIHVDDRALAELRRARYLREGQAGELEYRLVASDGRAIWFRESLVIEADSQGGPRVLRGCLWEINRRKKVERQLYTDRRQLAEHLTDVWHLYLLGGHLFATPEFEPILEEVLSAVTSLQGAELGAIRLWNADRNELETVVNQGLPAAYLERFGRLPLGVETCGLAVLRGEPVIVQDVENEPPVDDVEGLAAAARLGGFRACWSIPLVSQRGGVLGTVVTFFREPHQPSQWQIHLVEHYLRQAAEAVDNARRHLAARESDRRKGEFLATLAHELRNPLSAIQSCGQLLEGEDLDTASLGEIRDVILRQTRHMSRLIEDLLDIGRISRGNIALRKEPVELADIVARAMEHVQPLVDAHGHALTISLPEEPVHLEADPTRLEQILSNLLTNAAKYTDAGGRIELIAIREADDLVVRVRDTGIGLAPDAISSLFRLFAQADASQHRSRGGLGIGLALVKSLVELHDGSVSARSEGPGRGSEFTVRLPLAGGLTG
jgi:PAS domain S-box-containing protein